MIGVCIINILRYCFVPSIFFSSFPAVLSKRTLRQFCYEYNKNCLTPGMGQDGPRPLQFWWTGTMSSNSKLNSRVHHWLIPSHWCHYVLPSKPYVKTQGTIVKSRIDYYILGWKKCLRGIAAYVFNQFRRNNISLIATWSTCIPSE